MADLFQYVCDRCKKSFYAESKGAGAPAGCPWCLSPSLSRHSGTEPPSRTAWEVDTPRTRVESEGIEVFTRGMATPPSPKAKAVAAWIAFKDGHQVGRDAREVAGGPNATINMAELWAIVNALQWARDRGYSGIRVLSSSSTAIGWATPRKRVTRVEHAIALQRRALELVKEVSPELEWVHSRHNRAHNLCRTALRKPPEGNSLN